MPPRRRTILEVAVLGVEEEEVEASDAEMKVAMEEEVEALEGVINWLNTTKTAI